MRGNDRDERVPILSDAERETGIVRQIDIRQAHAGMGRSLGVALAVEIEFQGAGGLPGFGVGTAELQAEAGLADGEAGLGIFFAVQLRAGRKRPGRQWRFAGCHKPNPRGHIHRPAVPCQLFQGEFHCGSGSRATERQNESNQTLSHRVSSLVLFTTQIGFFQKKSGGGQSPFFLKSHIFYPSRVAISRLSVLD